MLTVFTYAFQLWGTMTKADIATEVVKGSITPDQYKSIVGEDYTAPATTTTNTPA
jgi:uncharacterized XkdX family phage protein